MGDVGLFVGPKTQAGCIKKLKGTGDLTIVAGTTFDHQGSVGLTKTAGTGLTGIASHGTSTSYHQWIWVGDYSVGSNGRWIATTANSGGLIVGAASGQARMRVNSVTLNSVGTANVQNDIVGFSRFSSTQYSWITGNTSGIQSQSGGVEPSEATLYHQSVNVIPDGSRIAAWGVGTSIDLSLVRSRFLAFYAALNNYTPLAGPQRRSAQASIRSTF
jgi:hypothetical protein